MSQHVFAWGERPTSPTPEANLPSNWVPDEERTSCLTCGEAFTLFLRKHHCRKCGEIFCHKCSSRRIPLPEISESAIPVRVCDACFLEKLTEGDQRPRASTLDTSRFMAEKRSSIGSLQHRERMETKRSVSWHPGHARNGATPVKAGTRANQKAVSWHPGHPANGANPVKAEATANQTTALNAHAASAAVVSTEQKTSAEQQHPVTSALEPAFASPPIGGRMQAQVKDLVSEIMCLCEKPDGWVKIARDGGITLYNRPSSEMPCFKGEGVLKFPLALIINFLQDRSLQHQWDDLYDVHRDVEICGAQTKIEYFRCKAIWPSQARDFCNLSHWRSWENQKRALSCSVAVQHDDCPSYSNYTRGEIGVSGWTFHEVTDENGRAITECNYVGQVDANTPLVPAWLIKKLTAKQGKLVLKIGELLGKMSQKDKQSYISKGVSNYWDNAVPVVDNGVPVSGQVGESKTQDSAWTVERLDIKRWYMTPQRTNHHKSLAWGREVQVGKLQLQDHLIFTAQSSEGQIFDFEVGLGDVDTQQDLWVLGKARDADSDASGMQMRVKLRVSMDGDEAEHENGCGKRALIWAVITFVILLTGLLMFPSCHFFFTSWLEPHLPLSTISLWLTLCMLLYHRNWTILRTAGLRTETLFTTPSEIRLYQE